MVPTEPSDRVINFIVQALEGKDITILEMVYKRVRFNMLMI
jgi:hypothetical protein